MARKISNHDEGEQNEMIMRYLEEVKKKILLNISHYAKIDSSMRSETIRLPLRILTCLIYDPRTTAGDPRSLGYRDFLSRFYEMQEFKFSPILDGFDRIYAAYGPLYFNAHPICAIFDDSNILDALTLNVKTHGYNYAPDLN
ncbi:hypothetical protein H5410_057580 [Solanum commersonii]|uniref:Uncharacterized protein n=1 Tax=Solanum commersonii TaxID=4109 RepID=A0A9J5WR81_SOLCO|nr:hypothetical protein H5410_057580 [Solanum commersonii]